MLQTIKALKKSPLYNLSLANKELFHSNFIAWFGKECPDLFVKLMKMLIGTDNSWYKELDIANLDIRREYKHFDIAVLDRNGHERLIIENKVKSIPTIDQLNDYEDKSDLASIYVLLSMNEQFQNTDCQITDTKWKFVSYGALATALLKINEEVCDTYHNKLIGDYCSYIYTLQMLIDKFTPKSSNGCFFFKQEDFDIQNELDIHDICGKRLAQSIYYQLRNCFNRDQLVNNVKNLDVGKQQFLIGWSYTNATPLIEVRFRAKAEEYVVIQIQGKQYRHCVEYFDDNNWGYRISKDNNGKFGPSEDGIKYLQSHYPYVILGNDAINNYPDCLNRKFGQRRKDNNDGYCKYCNGGPSKDGKYGCFVYQWVKIPNDMTIGDLVKAIHNDAMRLLWLSKNT